jgi:HPt (histidine-containing phosphotransfer) domain-containing protein
VKKTDLTYLLSMTEENNELILEMIDIFIDQVEEIWIEMQDLFNKKDYDSLGKLAHKAKSSVAILGMEALSKKLKTMELLCQTGKNTEFYQEFINEFKSECTLAINELQDYKKYNLLKKN